MRADLHETATFIDILVGLLQQEGIDEREANSMAERFVFRVQSSLDMDNIYDIDCLVAMLGLSVGARVVDCPVAPSSNGQPGTVHVLIGSGAIEYDPSNGYMNPVGEMYIDDDARTHLFDALIEKEEVRWNDRDSDQEYVEWWTQELLPHRKEICGLYNEEELPLLPGALPADIAKRYQWEPVDREAQLAILRVA